MDKTNYSLLSIVAIVALTAIVAMYADAQRNPAPSLGPTIVLSDGASTSGSALTGNVVAADRATRPVAATTQRARPELDWRSYDYNSDGVLNEEDTTILDAVVARARFCPADKTCDATLDGFVDAADKRVYYAAVLRIQAENEVAHEVLTATPSPAPSQDDDFWLATAGVPSN